MSRKCTVRGCCNKLDSTGRPVQYCDYQQGRCPMQEPDELNFGSKFCITMILITIIYLIPLTM